MKRFPLLVLLVLFPFLVAFRPQQQSNDLSIQIQAGIGGWYRAGQWIPLQVNVQSQNTTLNGKLQVRVGRQVTAATQFETTYSSPFTISSGGSKRVFLYVSLDDFARQIQVELVNQNGRVISSQQTDLRQLEYDDILQTVVTDSASGVLDVSRYTVGRGRNVQVAWRIDDIPANADALRSLDVMVFTDVDSGTLTLSQQEAVADWVAGGGHLIVTGGANWQRTTSGLVDLLPTEPQGTVSLDSIEALGDFLRRPSDILEATTLAVNNSPKLGSKVILESDDVSLLVRGKHGAGTVDFVAVDGTTEPLRSWSDLSYLWQELLYSADSRPSWTHGIERFELARDAVTNVTGFDLPSVLQLAAFLVVYIGLMGPLNYLFLSLVKRRELAWLTIPVFIVVFTAFAYVTGFSLRGNDVTVNQVSVVQVWEGVDHARVDGVIGILSPRRTTYDVIMPTGLNLRSLPNVAAPTSLTEVSINEGEQYIAQDIPVDAAIMTNFATSGYIDAPNFEGQASWTLRGQADSRLTGTVTNGLASDLEDAVILVDDLAIPLGKLSAGETRDFQLNLPLVQPSRLTLGNRVDPTRPVLYQQAFGYTQSYYDLCYITGGINWVYHNMMLGQQFTCNGGGDAEDLKLRRRALMIHATNNEIDLNGGRGTGVYLLGWSEEPSLQVQIPDVGQINDGTTLFIYEIPTVMEATNPNRVVLPPGMFSWTLIEQDQPNRLPEVAANLSFQLTGEQGVAIRFTPLMDAPLRQVDEVQLDLDWRLDFTNYLTVYLWNWETGEWQALEFTQAGQTRFIIEDKALIGPQQVVQVLVESDNAATFQTVEGVKVTMRGTE